jgi:excisionase family DNA binding protein
MKPDPRIAYSVNEAAKATGIGLTKLREEIRAGRLVARKLGKRTLVNSRPLTRSENLPRIDSLRKAA